MASAEIRIQTKVTDVGGGESSQRIYANTTAVPLQQFKGTATITVLPTEDPVQIDIGTMTADSLRSMVIEAKVATIYVSPLSSANVTAACVITADQALIFRYATNTALPWVIASTASAVIEYHCYGVAT